MKRDQWTALRPALTRRRLHRIVHLCVGVGLLAVFTLTDAAPCTLSATPVGFGAYDTFSISPKDSTGTVTVSCDTGVAYTVAISAGGSGSISNREMSFETNRLAYNLFTEPTHTIVWGDITGGTLVNGTGTGSNQIHTVYGRVPARQNVRAGTYADSLIVTVEF